MGRWKPLADCRRMTGYPEVIPLAWFAVTGEVGTGSNMMSGKATHQDFSRMMVIFYPGDQC